MRGELVNVRRVAEAALMIAVFTALAFQSIRFEQFETEKNAILGILALIIIGANVAEFIQLGRLPRIRNPLFWAVLAFLGVTTVSTIFSISPSYSFWGSPTRGHGLVMVIIYVVLFWQAMRSGQRLKEGLVPILALVAIAMIVYGLQNYIETVQSGIIRFRPASTAGNPNYFAGWLTMFLAMFGLLAYQRIRNIPRPYQWWQWVEIVFYSAIVVAGVATFVILSSRGAFAGFAIAIGVGAIIFFSLYKRRILLAGFIIVGFIGLGAYLAVNQSLQEEGRSANFSGIERLFIVYDESRIVLWDAAINLLRQQGRPFVSADGDEDTWAFLRPALGYGLETLEQTQERFGEDFHQSRWGDRYVERFHNLFYDWSTEVGSLGLLTLIIIYQVAFYLGMRYLGFIKPEQIWYWLLIQLVTVPLGVLITARIIWQADWVALIPLGSALGAMIGTLLWIIRGAFATSVPKAPPRLDRDAVAVIALMCVVSAQWIDNQFGFMQILSQTLFFILIGLLASLTADPEDVEAITYDENEAIAESNYWLGATLVTGLFFLYGFGVAIDSDFTRGDIAVAELPLFMGVILLTGAIGGIIQRFYEFQAEPQTTNGNGNKKTRSKSKKSRSKSTNSNRRDTLVIILAATVLLWPVVFGASSVFNLVEIPQDEIGQFSQPTPLGQQPQAAQEPPPNVLYADNFYAFLEYGSPGLITILGILFLAGTVASVVGWFLDQESKAQYTGRYGFWRSVIIPLLFILLAWLVFFFVKYLLMRTGSDTLDDALRSGPSATGVRNAYGILSFNGIILISFVVGTFFWLLKGRVKFSMSLVGGALILVAIAAGSLFYSRNFTVATMRAAADGFTGQDIGPALVAADRIYEVAAATQPDDVKLRLTWADSLMTQIALINEQSDPQLNAVAQIDTLLTRVQNERDAALDAAPYFIHSRTWDVFNQNYNLFVNRFNTGQFNPPTTQQNPNVPPGLPGNVPSNVPPGFPGESNLPPGAQQPPGVQPPGNP